MGMMHFSGQRPSLRRGTPQNQEICMLTCQTLFVCLPILYLLLFIVMSHQAVTMIYCEQWDFGPCFRCFCRRLCKISAQPFLWSAALWCRNADSPNLQDLISWCCIFLAVPSTAHLPARSLDVQLKGHIDSCKRNDQMLFLSPHSEASSDSYRCTSIS